MTWFHWAVGYAVPLLFFGSCKCGSCKHKRYPLHCPSLAVVYISLDEQGRTKGKAAIDVVGSQAGKSGGSMLQQLLLVLSSGTIAGSLPIMFIVYTLMAQVRLRLPACVLVSHGAGAIAAPSFLPCPLHFMFSIYMCMAPIYLLHCNCKPSHSWHILSCSLSDAHGTGCAMHACMHETGGGGDHREVLFPLSHFPALCSTPYRCSTSQGSQSHGTGLAAVGGEAFGPQPSVWARRLRASHAERGGGDRR